MQIRYDKDEETQEILRGIAKVKNFTAVVEAQKLDGSEPPSRISVRENPTTGFEQRDEREGFTHKVKVTYENPTRLHFRLNNHNDVEPFIPSGTPAESAEHMAERAQTFLHNHRADLLAMRDHIVQWNGLPPEERGRTELPTHRELKQRYAIDPILAAESGMATTSGVLTR